MHHNIFSGIAVYGGEWHEDDPDYQIPYPHGNYNVFRDNVLESNSDVGLSSNGGNADGIVLSSGGNNTIVHNTVYSNSDDGIDTWRSNDSFIAFNLVYDNGRADGDGNGIKMGGNASPSATNGLRTIADHNISYNNKRTGIDYNSGKQLIIKYNTAFSNGDRGVNALNSSVIEHNIASNNANQYSGLGTNNSWNVQANIPFISTDPSSHDFLRPLVGSQFEDKGVYADLTAHNYKIFIIGDSTVHNNSTGEQGYGSRLGEYMINPDNMFNMARSGASTKSYRPDKFGTTHDWPGLIDKIENTDIEDGAYLLIQFGHNDEDESRSDAFALPERYNSFYNNLKVFVDEVKALGVTPVLVTPVQRMYKGQNTHITAYGNYPQTIRDLADDEGVLLLDLSQRSFDKFDEYPSTAAIFDAFAYDDHTHFDPEGAYTVAAWVRDLACESSDENLCNQFRR